MDIKDTINKIKVMEAFAKGVRVECLTNGIWINCTNPLWDWYNYTYRAKLQEYSKELDKFAKAAAVRQKYSMIDDVLAFMDSLSSEDLDLFTHTNKIVRLLRASKLVDTRDRTEDIEAKTLAKIEVMTAFTEGKSIESKSVEFCLIDRKNNVEDWYDCVNPLWDWYRYDYRVKLEKPSINWDHISPEYNYLATDRGGYSYLYKKKPITDQDIWISPDDSGYSGYLTTLGFVSFKPGNGEWTESLVCRPGMES